MVRIRSLFIGESLDRVVSMEELMRLSARLVLALLVSSPRSLLFIWAIRCLT